MKRTFFGCVLAALFWFVLFSPWTSGRINFWAGMAGASGLLALFGLVSNKSKITELYAFQPRWIVVGLLSAAVLYGIFYVGDKISTTLFEFAAPGVAGIYGTKSQASPVVIGTLLLLWIGPAEEIFWRGFVQERFAGRFGAWRGYMITGAIYGGVHIWAFNVMLFAAALICGLFWGWMFLKYKSVWPGLISHSIWDLLIFVLLPIR